MQTLSDVHKRGAYDNIFGFDEDAINPFKDTAESRDQVTWSSSSHRYIAHDPMSRAARLMHHTVHVMQCFISSPQPALIIKRQYEAGFISSL